MGVVSLSYLFGDAAARRFMGWLLEAGLGLATEYSPWRPACWRRSCLLAIGCGCGNRRWRSASPSRRPIRTTCLARPAAPGRRPPSLRELLVPLVTSPVFLVVCLLSLGLTLLRETFNTWTPAYFTDALGSSKRRRRRATSALFPLLGGVAVLAAGWLGDGLGSGGRAA